jgi:hypothetical protein
MESPQLKKSKPIVPLRESPSKSHKLATSLNDNGNGQPGQRTGQKRQLSDLAETREVRELT